MHENHLSFAPRDQDDAHNDAHPEGRIVQSGRRHRSMKLMCLENHVNRQVDHEEQAPTTSGNQEQDDDFDFGLTLMLQDA
ncbi:hypothetical protein Tco_0204504 [Tanacetum coccineum]